MIGGIERVRDIIALYPDGGPVFLQIADVRDVLAAMDSAERAIIRAHAALATERERAEAAEKALATLAEIARECVASADAFRAAAVTEHGYSWLDESPAADAARDAETAASEAYTIAKQRLDAALAGCP